jgi:hypothetical protein
MVELELSTNPSFFDFETLLYPETIVVAVWLYDVAALLKLEFILLPYKVTAFGKSIMEILYSDREIESRDRRNPALTSSEFWVALLRLEFTLFSDSQTLRS